MCLIPLIYKRICMYIVLINECLRVFIYIYIYNYFIHSLHNVYRKIFRKKITNVYFFQYIHLEFWI